MSHAQKILFSALTAGGLLLVSVSALSDKGPQLGSVNVASEYIATTTKNFAGTAMPNLSVLKAESGALGQITITGASTGVINLYDATSTVTNTAWATTTLVSIPASAAAGTYVFDVRFTKGLLVEIIGAAPTSTISFR